MRKQLKLKEIFFRAYIFIILPLTLISAENWRKIPENYLKDKVAPSKWIPNPEKGYIYGNFHAYRGDALSFEDGERRYEYRKRNDGGGIVYTHYPDINLIRIGKSGVEEIFFRQIKKSENDPIFILEVDPGMFQVYGEKIPMLEPAILYERFNIEAGQIYYLGDFLRNYERYYEENHKGQPLGRGQRIRHCNHFTKTTGILKRKYPHFANLPIGSLYEGEPECKDTHLNSDPDPEQEDAITKLKRDFYESRKNPFSTEQFRK